MLQLSSQNIIQFSCFVICAILIVFILNSRQMKLRKLLLLFLAPAAGACLCGLLTALRQPYEELLLWKMLVIPLSAWSVIGYAHFITAYAGQNTRKIFKLGYSWLAVTFVLVAFGYFAQGITFLDNPFLTACYGHVINALVFANGFFVIPVGILLVRVLKNAADPEERNRTAYLLAGLGLLVLAYAAAYVMRDSKNSFANIGFAGNAIIITYTLLKYRLLNIQQLMKKWVTYTFITISVTLAYLAMLLILSNLLRLLPPHLGIPATVIMVVLFAYLFNWLKSTLDRAADRLFYGNRYLHRKMLLDFAEKTSTFINIEDIANALLGPLVKVVRARQVDLLLPANDLYCTKFVARLSEEEEIVPMCCRAAARWCAGSKAGVCYRAARW